MCEGVPCCFAPVKDVHLDRFADLALSKFEELFYTRRNGAGR